MIPTLRLKLLQLPRKPRASGDDPDDYIPRCQELGVNPARAGMIPVRVTPLTVTVCKPRASGDDPTSSGDIVRWSL